MRAGPAGHLFRENGASQRPSKVIYDRAHSAIAEAKPEDFDWDKIFSGKDWFHITGITPALSEGMAEIPAGGAGSQGPRLEGELRPQLPGQAVEQGACR